MNLVISNICSHAYALPARKLKEISIIFKHVELVKYLGVRCGIPIVNWFVFYMNFLHQKVLKIKHIIDNTPNIYVTYYHFIKHLENRK